MCNDIRLQFHDTTHTAKMNFISYSKSVSITASTRSDLISVRALFHVCNHEQLQLKGERTNEQTKKSEFFLTLISYSNKKKILSLFLIVIDFSESTKEKNHRPRNERKGIVKSDAK